MKVVYIYQDQYPWDVRVEKIMESLAAKGIEGHIVSKNSDGLSRCVRLKDNLFIHRLPKGLGRIIRFMVNFPAFFSPIWLIVIIKTVIKYNINLIIVRDLPLAITAYWAGRLTKKPVVIDMAENYPAMIQDTWTYRGVKLIDYIIRNPKFLRKMEHWIIPKMNGALVVSLANKERLVNMGIKSAVIWIVSNTPNLSEIDNDYEHLLAKKVRERSSLILLYVGGLEESRGLETVIHALPMIKRIKTDILFMIIGKGTSEQRLKYLGKELDVADNMIFPGWIEHKYIYSLIRSADICIVPHYVSEHTDTTIPNKIFDYMVQKKPIVVTHSKSLSEIVNLTGCGRVYHDNCAKELANIILELRNPVLREKLGKAGYRAVQEKYNWGIDEQNLFNAVETIGFRDNL